MPGFIFKRMPEDFPHHTDERKKGEELKQLRSKLEGNQTFGRSRGTWSMSLSEHANRLLDEYETIDELNAQADRLCKDFKTMLVLQHRLMLKGHYWSRAELVEALQERHYLLPNENFPFEETEPVVGVMYEPETTVPLLQWILTADHRALFSLLEGRDPEEFRWNTRNLEHSVALSQKLLHNLPSLNLELFEHRRHESEIVDNRSRPVLLWQAKIMAAYAVDVLSKYPVLPNCQGQALLAEDRHFRLPQDVENVLTSYQPGHLSVMNHWPSVCGTVFLVPGWKRDILPLFSRDQQAQVAMWQFQVPKCIGWRNKHFGLHEESEHESLRQQRSALVSKGLDRSLGSMVLPYRDKELYPVMDNYHYNPGNPFRLLFRWY